MAKKKQSPMEALMAYNKELGRKEKAAAKKNPGTKKTQAKSKPIKLTRLEKAAGLVGKKVKKVASNLVGKKYDKALKKRKKKNGA